jgi:hypothetical protein
MYAFSADRHQISVNSIKIFEQHSALRPALWTTNEDLSAVINPRGIRDIGFLIQNIYIYWRM